MLTSLDSCAWMVLEIALAPSCVVECGGWLSIPLSPRSRIGWSDLISSSSRRRSSPTSSTLRGERKHLHPLWRWPHPPAAIVGSDVGIPLHQRELVSIANVCSQCLIVSWPLEGGRGGNLFQFSPPGGGLVCDTSLAMATPTECLLVAVCVAISSTCM